MSTAAMRMPALLAVLAAFASVVGVCGRADASVGRPAEGPGTRQLLLAIERPVAARAAPDARAREVAVLSAWTPLTRSRMVVPVLGSAVGSGGVRWLRVRLPTRAGVAGWVTADAGSITSTPWVIVIERGKRRALAYKASTVQASFPVVVGKPSTPTPLGRYFVVEKLRFAPGVTEGPWALATSAYSGVLHTYAGGPGQVALHGTVGFRDPLGTAASHGCVRFSPGAITWLATHVSDGTPVLIVP